MYNITIIHASRIRYIYQIQSQKVSVTQEFYRIQWADIENPGRPELCLFIEQNL
jgi:hypothetical protein